MTLLTLSRQVTATLLSAVLLSPALADADTTAPALQPTYTAGELHIVSPWLRATPPGAKNGAAYMQLHNGSAEADTLISAHISEDIAERVELHTHIRDGDIMRMRELENGIAMEAETTTQLAPGGLHIMIMGLKEPLQAGHTTDITLEFEHHGRITLQRVPVLSADTLPQPMMQHGDKPHNH